MPSAARGSRAATVVVMSGLLMLLDLGVFVLALWAFVDALIRPAPAFVAAGKQTKQIWLLILGAGLFLTLIGLGGFLGLLGAVVAVASIVYLVDVRPAVRGTPPGGPWG